jgi:DNA-binding LacI/PurR family transcriptional regulator
MKKSMTISEVARELGVSPATVSSAFSGKGTITASRREAVLQAARELGYEPNPIAQRLKSGRNPNTIAIFSPALDLGIGVQQIQWLQGALNERGFEAQLYAHPYEAPRDFNPGSMLRALRFEKPRALICNGGWHFSEADRAELEQFIEEGGDAVFIAYGAEANVTCDQVVFDEAHSAQLATQHLLELGHRDIAYGAHELKIGASFHESGYRRALEEAGIAPRAEWMLDSEQTFYEESGAKLADQFLKLNKRPSAIIINNDRAASAFINVVQRAGIRVPHDVSVVGIDDTPAARFAAVPMTAVSYPLPAIVYSVIDTLFTRLGGNSGARRIKTIRGELVVRESTAAL